MKKVTIDSIKTKAVEIKDRALDFYAEHYDAVNLVAGIAVFGATCYGAGRSSERRKAMHNYEYSPHIMYAENYKDACKKMGFDPNEWSAVLIYDTMSCVNGLKKMGSDVDVVVKGEKIIFKD